MKKTGILFVYMLIIGCFFNAQAQNKKIATGSWKYAVEEAPYGYEKGVFTITEQKNVLSGEVVFSSGYKTSLQNVTFSRDTLRASVYVEAEEVKLATQVKGNKMEGEVHSSMGTMKLKAEKIASGRKKQP